MDDFTQQLLAIFRQEVGENLDKIALCLEKMKSGDVEARKESAAIAYRTTHNTKGAALSAGFDDVELIAHAIEDVIKPFVESGDQLSEELHSTLLDGIALVHKSCEGEKLGEAIGAYTSRIKDEIKALGKTGKKKKKEKRKTDRRKKEDAQPAGDAAKENRQPAQPEEAPAQKPETGGDYYIKVEVARVDSMVESAGEMLVLRSRFHLDNQRLRKIEKQFKEAAATAPPEVGQYLEKHLEDIKRATRAGSDSMLAFERLTEEIGAAARKLRMVPLIDSSAGWRRIVRETAAELNKKVKLTIHVEGIELDKQVLDKLRDPLMHILRNSVDHGIENPEERASAGKDETGEIMIRATTTGPAVALEISDDGRGLSPEKIAFAAIDKGIISPDQLDQLTDSEKKELIFHSGFSTAEKLSNVSGRGVGMDIVRRAMVELGGGAEVLEPPSIGGTSFLLSTPVNVVSIKGLLLGSDRLVFAAPVENIDRVMLIEASEISEADNAPIIEIAGEPIRLKFLSSLFGRGKFERSEMLRVVVISYREGTIGLVVDEIIGEQEFLVKRFPWNLKKIEGLSGAFILGDGAVGYLLEVGSLFTAGAEIYRGSSILAAASGSKRIPKILVVDDSVTSRALIRNILSLAGYEVVVAVNGAAAWEALAAQEFDLVITDVEMPVMGGFELTEKIRADSSTKDLPVILVSGLGGESDLARGAAVGADEYIIKGQFDQQALVEAVARYLIDE